MLDKPCGIFKLAHILVTISQVSHIRQAMWHFQIGTHVSQH
jgi:hypothetical protein